MNYAGGDDSSRAIANVLGSFNFFWNDLIPYAPDQNRDVDQMLLRTLLDDGLLSELVVAYEQRMQNFITSEQSKGRTALVVVAGTTANAAYRLFPLPDDPVLNVFPVAGFKIVQYRRFTALLDVPHPSAHLMKGMAPVPAAIFKESIAVAGALLVNPRSTSDELLRQVSASAQNRHDNNAHAIAELKLPGCEGSWFSPEFRHLRYIDWTIVLPVVQDMLRRMTMDSIWQLLKNGSLTSRLHDPAFTDSLNTWLGVLGNDGFVTFMCNGVAARLHDPAFKIGRAHV